METVKDFVERKSQQQRNPGNRREFLNVKTKYLEIFEDFAFVVLASPDCIIVVVKIQ